MGSRLPRGEHLRGLTSPHPSAGISESTVRPLVLSTYAFDLLALGLLHPLLLSLLRLPTTTLTPPPLTPSASCWISSFPHSYERR